MSGPVPSASKVALAGLAGLVAVGVLAYAPTPARELDGIGFELAQRVMRWTGVQPAGNLLLVPMLLPLYALLSGWALLRAWRGRGAAAAVAAASVLLGANGLAQVLKLATATERPWSATQWGSSVDPASWPSGHATAAAALVLAFALGAATPEARRRVVRIGGAWAASAGLAVVWLGWHLPSDTLAAWCVVALVGAAATAGLGAWARRASPRAAQASVRCEAPGCHSTSLAAPLTARERMNSRSESRLR